MNPILLLLSVDYFKPTVTILALLPVLSLYIVVWTERRYILHLLFDRVHKESIVFFGSSHYFVFLICERK